MLIRRPPMSPFREVIRLMQDDPFFRAGNGMFEETTAGNLAVDIIEREDSVVVRASVPGFRKEDIEIQVHNGVLTIKAEREEEVVESNDNYHVRERHSGSLTRRVDLPGLVSDRDATAELNDGVLTVTIPQAEEARPKQISIK